MNTNIYTEAVIAAMRAASPLNAEKCAQLAEQFNAKTDGEPYTAQGFITKSRSVEGVEYERKARNVTKNGDPAMSKADIVSAIEQTLGANANSLESLVKADKATLQALSALIPETENA